MHFSRSPFMARAVRAMIGSCLNFSRPRIALTSPTSDLGSNPRSKRRNLAVVLDQGVKDAQQVQIESVKMQVIHACDAQLSFACREDFEATSC